MKVMQASSAGFCYGVNRAVDLVEQAARGGKPTVTYGPIAHNRHLVAHFEALGIRAAYDEKLGHARHVFTHLIWEMDVHAVVADEMTQVPGGQWVSRQELAALPLPTAVKAARQWAMERLTE